MDQTVLFFILIACIIAQALFLLNHRYFLRGIIFSAVSGAGCLVLMQSFFPFLGLAVTAPSLIKLRFWNSWMYLSSAFKIDLSAVIGYNRAIPIMRRNHLG